MAFSKHPAWWYGIIGLVLGVGLVAGFVYWQQENPPVHEPFHIHVDFKFFIDGESLNFNSEKYMSASGNVLHHWVHLHDGKGNVIHFHARNISLKTFFETLSFDIDSNCVVTDLNQSYCADETKTWKVWVNGKEVSEGFEYVPEDLDRILISYGNDTTEKLQVQFDTVTDVACIQSEECPERGKPDNEDTCSGSGECPIGEIPVHS